MCARFCICGSNKETRLAKTARIATVTNSSISVKADLAAGFDDFVYPPVIARPQLLPLPPLSTSLALIFLPILPICGNFLVKPNTERHTMSDTTVEPSKLAETKLESSTAHAKAALDATTTAAKEVIETGRKHAGTAISTSKEHLSLAAKDLSDAATAKYSEIKSQATTKAEEVKGRAQEAFGQASTKAQSFQSDAEQFVRDNPMQSIGIAVGVGFIFGLILRR